MLYNKNIIEVLNDTIVKALTVCNDTTLYTERDKIPIICYLFQSYNYEYKQFLETLDGLQRTFSNFYHDEVDINNPIFINLKEMRSVYQYRYEIVNKIDEVINKINEDSSNSGDKLPTLRQLTNILTTPYKENTTFSSYCLYTKDVETGLFKQVPVYEEYLEKWKTIQGKSKGSVNVLILWLKRYTSLIKNKLEESTVKNILQELNKNNYKIRDTNIDIEQVTKYWEKVKEEY